MTRFPKSARLLTSREFHKVNQKGIYLTGSFLVLNILKQPLSSKSKLGISVPRQYGKAHLRNKFKRRVRELFRHTAFNSSCYVHVKPRLPAKEATFDQLSEEYKKLVALIHS